MNSKLVHLLSITAIALCATGCATKNVNPPHARANTGHVDFCSDPSDDLCWQVARFDERVQTYKKVFSEVTPPPGRILRLAFVPGQYRLQVTFLNRVVQEPALIEVKVEDGLVTPVVITLVPGATTWVESKQLRVGTTVKGRYGWKTKYSSDASAIFQISAKSGPPLPYQPKELSSKTKGPE